MAPTPTTDARVLALMQPGETVSSREIARRLGQKVCHVYRVIGCLRRLQEAGQVEQVRVERGAVTELVYRRSA